MKNIIDNQLKNTTKTEEMEDMKNMLNKIEELGWSVYGDIETGFEFGKFSDMGQDFHISLFAENEKDLTVSIYDYYNNFDVSEEACIWLDDTGHGVNGAPYDMIDVYKDMEQCKEMILELYEDLKLYQLERK